MTRGPERWWSPAVLAVEVAFTPAATAVYLAVAFLAPGLLYRHPAPRPAAAPVAPIIPLRPAEEAPHARAA